jgi:hypothetical protein
MQNEQNLSDIIFNTSSDRTCFVRKSDSNNGNEYSTILYVCKNNLEKTSNCVLENNINIYRFKFTTEFTEKLYEFSKLHEYDNRNDYKDSWNQWTKDNAEIIEMECERLYRLEYRGNIMDKMFKSARYYFRKKSNQVKTPVTRKKYISISKDLLEKMDTHLHENSELKPKNGFVDFCNQYKELLKESILEIYKNGITDSEEIEEKIKKTYKNRYFMHIKNENKK